MEITLTQALAGKATQIKGKEYMSTEAYITPFIERMSKFTDNFKIQAIPAGQISLTKEGEINMEDMVYNRMYVQAIMPDTCGFDDINRVVGMVYGLDTRKPIAKLFVGGLDMACCNLCVFDPSFLHLQEIEPERAINFKPLNNLLEQTSNVQATITKLMSVEVPYEEPVINENLGLWLRNAMNKQLGSNFGKVKVATSTVIDAFKLLYQDKESRYYINPGQTTDMFNVYGAFTQCLTDDTKDIFNRVEKTLVVSDIIGI